MPSTKLTFFRQSSIMVLATAVSGLFMMGASIVAQRMGPAEYAVFRTLLTAYLLMSIPTIGLQLVFTQQAAAAPDAPDRARLSGMIRRVLGGTFILWAVASALVLLGSATVREQFNIRDPRALWLTLGLGLSSLWLPVLRGVLQGTQNFASYGGVMVMDGLLRFVSVFAIVSIGGNAAGGLSGALVGQLAALGLAFWFTRAVWRGRAGPVDWKAWLARVIPLTMGFGSMVLMTSADMLYVQSVFASEQTKYYVPGQLLGVALFTATAPLALVMFPKIVVSARQAHRTDALSLALGTTGLILGLAALFLTLLPELPLRLIFYSDADYWKGSVLVPWFAWALLPLILANVLVNDLMARGRFGIAPWLALVAAGYGLALFSLKDQLKAMETFAAFKTVLGTLGVFSVAMLAVAIYFSRKETQQTVGQARTE